MPEKPASRASKTSVSVRSFFHAVPYKKAGIRVAKPGADDRRSWRLPSERAEGILEKI